MADSCGEPGTCSKIQELHSYTQTTKQRSYELQSSRPMPPKSGNPKSSRGCAAASHLPQLHAVLAWRISCNAEDSHELSTEGIANKNGAQDCGKQQQELIQDSTKC